MIDFEKRNNLQKFGIELILPGDANFVSELNRHIAEFNVVLPLIEAAKPLVGFIKNNSSKEVVGMSLSWDFFNSDSEEVFSTSGGVVASIGELTGKKPRDPWMVGKMSLINSKELRFFSYFFDATQTIENIHKRVKYRRINYEPTVEDIQRTISYIEYRKSSEPALRNAFKAIVSFNGMFFNDGTFAGHNRDFFFELINGSIQAERDSLIKLREARASGKSDSEILTQFVKEISEKMQQIPVYRPARPGVRFVDSQSAFNQGYKSKLKSFEQEIIRRKTKFSDTIIINDYLEVDVDDFIEIHREN